MSAPANGHLGTNQLFKEGDLVMYQATPFWKSPRGMWFDVEGKIGEVTQVTYNSTYTYNPLADIHPYSYQVLFDINDRSITPAAENLHPASRGCAWEL